jgi:parvulin-like peptidyl-prolyl isomerase
MKRVAVAVMALLIVGAVTSFGRPLRAQTSTIIQKVIVKVNGEIFTQTELEFEQIMALKQDNRNVANADALKTDAALIAVLAPITPKILVAAVDELLIVQHGREITRFTDERFQEMLERLKKSNQESLDKYAKENKVTTEQAFQAALKEEGITLAQLRVNMERVFFKQVVQQRELQKGMTLTDQEAREYYKAHLNEFMKPATVSVRELFVNVPTTTGPTGQASVSVGVDEDAKAKITAARDRALKGEDFAKLVAELSDSPTKSNGGLMGPVPQTDLNPIIAAAIEKLKPGEISEPLRRAGGYQILKLETKIDAEPESFEKSRDAIGQKIVDTRMETETTKFIQKLLTQAVIEWKDETYKKMYETERALQMKTTPAGKGGH